ncbi:hypothetical protein MBLNU459_g1000t1 [Dothideomycetes sp. NU459]
MDGPQGSPHVGTAKSHDLSKPESPYLHDRLQARRNQAKRSRRSDFGPRARAFDNDIFFAEAEAEAEALSHSNASTPAPGKGTPQSIHRIQNGQNRSSGSSNGIGARELDKRLDQLSKLNFDLKMELFHCREKMVKMQEQCGILAARAEYSDKLVEENKTLLDLNDSLVKELEKRDTAVQEAVSIICDLEERIEHLEQLPSTETPSMPQSRRTTKKHLTSDPTTSGPQPITPESLTRSSKRIPSFVCEKKPSTTALRSVYLEPAPRLQAIKSYTSLLSQRESRADDGVEVDILDSPRLSVLSESSFPSIYNSNKPVFGPGDALGAAGGLREDSQALSQLTYDRYRSDNNSISQWVESRVCEDFPRQVSEDSYLEQPPADQHLQSRPFTGLQHQSLSNNFVTKSGASQLKILSDTRQTSQHENRKQNRFRSISNEDLLRTGRPSLGGPIFGETFLPPTPESASTRLLRESRSSMADSKSLGRASAKLDNENNASKRDGAAYHSVNSIAFGTHNNLLSRSWQDHNRWNNRNSALSSSEEEDEDTAPQDVETASSTIRDLENESYPTGGSIVTGTPSRFQIRHVSPVATNMLFDGDGMDEVIRPVGRRRNTSVEIQFPTSSERPNLERAETSPNLLRVLAPNEVLENAASQNTSPSRSRLHLTPEKRRLSDRRGPHRSPPKLSKTTALAAASKPRHPTWVTTRPGDLALLETPSRL